MQRSFIFTNFLCEITKNCCKNTWNLGEIIKILLLYHIFRYDLTGVPLDVVILTVFLKLLRQFSTDFALLCLKMFVWPWATFPSSYIFDIQFQKWCESMNIYSLYVSAQFAEERVCGWSVCAKEVSCVLMSLHSTICTFSVTRLVHTESN